MGFEIEFTVPSKETLDKFAPEFDAWEVCFNCVPEFATLFEKYHLEPDKRYRLSVEQVSEQPPNVPLEER